MTSFLLPPGYVCIKCVSSFQGLVSTPFADGVNALCWPRVLTGDFAEVVAGLEAEDRGQVTEDSGVIPIDESRLRGLRLGAGGRAAVDVIIEDLRLLREQGREPVLNCINDYPRDDSPGPVPTDVFSFHADSAPVEADTWLCTYHGTASEGLRNEEARRKVDVPAIRAELLKLHGRADDATFRRFLAENHYDLHYAPQPGAKPWSFGLFNLWRIAVDWPGSPVPPCVHRAPETDQPRLLLIA